MEQPFKSYYSILPSEVRYCKQLSANEKLLYSEITALTNAEGYCFASNAYFSELYGVHKGTISKWISNLSKQGFITTFDHIMANRSIQRRIFIGMEGVHDNINPPTRNDEGGYIISDTPLHEKMNHNNTINTKINNTINKELVFPFDSKEFLDKWNEWIDERKQRKIKPYTKRGAQGALHNLQKISGNNEQTAIQIINQSITQGWQGLFELKIKTNERDTSDKLARLIADKYKD